MDCFRGLGCTVPPFIFLVIAFFTCSSIGGREKPFHLKPRCLPGSDHPKLYHHKPHSHNKSSVMFLCVCDAHTILYYQYIKFLFNPLKPWVSNAWPARLYYVAQRHICILCVYYKNYTVIYVTGYITYYFSTCGP
jgi:hypothetical protein